VIKRTIVLAAVIGTLLGMRPLAGLADTPKGQVMNQVAVCGCGKVFVPTADTRYVEYNGKSYPCCTEGCYKMAMLNPETSAKISDEVLAKMMMKSEVKLSVANVTMIDDAGTHALCACGKEFVIAANTPYLKTANAMYACCSKACHDSAAKDLVKSEQTFKDAWAKYMATR
jgi:hypothetical protein